MFFNKETFGTLLLMFFQFCLSLQKTAVGTTLIQKRLADKTFLSTAFGFNIFDHIVKQD